VLGISVAALMTPAWVARWLDVPPGTDRVIVPGWCQGDLSVVEEKAHVPVERGPKDLRDLGEHFGAPAAERAGYGGYTIEIIAEINHVPARTRAEVLELARRYRAEGADVIDIGCDPVAPWPGVAELVRALGDDGCRVSIDSFDPREIALAVRAGAELVLSVNGTNRAAAADWGCEVVAVPDDIAVLGGLDATVEQLEARGVPYRIDPVLEPIGFGFAASLGRYLEARRRWPESAMMMGVGNLTELSDVDSAGVNTLLVGFCEELRIGSVLTTEVINWARSSVREIDLARRLVHYALAHRVLPKHLEPRLVVLRDPRVHEHGLENLDELARRITDPNFRIFAERGEIHVINGRGWLRGTDPFVLFEKMLEQNRIDAPHAFYLGYELAKAVTALTLSKDYRQDQALDWGYLTRPETAHRVAGEPGGVGL
jgi:dihydropteroate synthase-like protein